jgi:MFS family permease
VPNAIANNAMLPAERRAIAVLASSVSLRMIGLFMLLPVMALYARGMEGSTPFLIGVAVGCYGLTQALMQIPLGMLSDRIGRKPVIIGGLTIFALGSLLASVASSIEWLIVARLLQGAGAVAAASSALAADLTRESQRTKAMAIVGISIGGSFMLAIVIGPALAGVVSISGLLVVAAAMGLAAAGMVGLCIPRVPVGRAIKGLGSLGSLLSADFLRIDFGVFVLHAALTAIFVVLPQQLTIYGSGIAAEWMVYLSSLLLSFAVIAPVLWKVDRGKGAKRLFSLASAFLLLGLVILSQADALLVAWMGLSAFFVGFNILEASMPSLVSKKAPAEGRGAAMGLFTTAQFLGTFVGGVVSGGLLGAFNSASVYLACAVLVTVWLVFVLLAPPSDFES